MNDQNKQNTCSRVVEPVLMLRKIGIVSHDYRLAEADGSLDFSFCFFDILDFLAERGCDSVLFALYTLEYQHRLKKLARLPIDTSLKAIFLEEYRETKAGKAVTRFVVYSLRQSCWHRCLLRQKIVRNKYTQYFLHTVIQPFLQEIRTQRHFGNAVLLLCGESNVVRYSTTIKAITDPYRFLEQVSDTVTVILNPVHDRMTRFEMKLKRQFLSRNHRWVISVWNKGKADCNGQVKDGTKPAWTVFYNGQEIIIPRLDVSRIASNTNLEIGIVNITETGQAE